MSKIKLRNDKHVDWKDTKVDAFPFTTAAHSFHQDCQIDSDKARWTDTEKTLFYAKNKNKLIKD